MTENTKKKKSSTECTCGDDHPFPRWEPLINEWVTRAEWLKIPRVKTKNDDK